ncbi:MAG: hypothetical protein II210_00935, partial [Rikenellaceae bacterium]|nr:hypothetical protein [Rikenellaceae bacterium]
YSFLAINFEVLGCKGMKNDAKFKIRDSKLHNSLVVPDEIYPNIISEISDFVHLRGRVFVVSSLRLNPSSVAGGACDKSRTSHRT